MSKTRWRKVLIANRKMCKHEVGKLKKTIDFNKYKIRSYYTDKANSVTVYAIEKDY